MKKYLLFLFFSILLTISVVSYVQFKKSKKIITHPVTTKITTETPQNTVKMIFVGDIMLDRYIRQMANKNGGYDFIFQKVKDKFTSANLVIGDLEGPITTSKSISENSIVGSRENYIFTFDPVVVDTLVTNNINLVSLGNNHIYNFGMDGLQSTVSNLKSKNIDYFGYLGETDLASISTTKTIEGSKFTFINFNQFIPGSKESTLQAINDLKSKSDFVIVYAHWGNEYETKSSVFQQELAHKFIDTGADMVIASHPHVVQESEVYKGKQIYYSLGNFIMDQYFSPETQEGLMIEAEINTTTKNITFKEYKVNLKLNGQTVFAEPL